MDVGIAQPWKDLLGAMIVGGDIDHGQQNII